MNLHEWLSVYSDLDAYMDRGGQLLDIQLIDFDTVPPHTMALISNQIGKKKVERLGRFFGRVGQALGAKEIVLATMTEEQLRMLWRETAESIVD